jgi:uncharacterized protein (DUF58 family)
MPPATSILREARAARPAASPSPSPRSHAPIDLRLLADLPSLELRSRYLVDGYLSGRHRSPLKGQSIEFVEYRGYQQGDDLRHVDWRLYGRSDRLCVKMFEEETQLRVYLLLDASGSMAWRGERALFRKVDYARLALAAIATLARRQRDATGVAIAGGRLESFLPPLSSDAHYRSVFGMLDNPAGGGETRLAQSISEATNLMKRRSLVVIASDFYEDIDRLEQTVGRLRYEGHDVMGLHVLDPAELDFADDLKGIFVDVEDGSQVTLSSAEVRAAYLREFGAFRSQLARVFEDVSGDLVTLRTDEPPIEALSAYLFNREQRR